jgi:predicted enzyme related to lactoylglutathione lyase
MRNMRSVKEPAMVEDAMPQVGVFCWPELCSADAEGSKRFYGAVFGWQAEDQKMPGGVYTLFKLEGQNIGAMYQTTEDRLKAGVRPHWNSYVSVEDAQDAVRKTAELGGKVLSPPFDAGEEGIMANLQDPNGVNFCIWQSKRASASFRYGEIGSLCWTELFTRDPERSAAFYSALFGWQAKPFDENNAMHYTVFNLPGEDRGVGGMLTMTPEMPFEPHWLPYFRVANADEAVQRTQDAGGSVLNPPMDIPNVGRIAMLADSQGAPFAIIQVAM